MMLPSVSAVQYNTVKELNTVQIPEKIKELDINELKNKIQGILGDKGIYYPGMVILTLLYAFLIVKYFSLWIRSEIWYSISGTSYHGVEHPIALLLGDTALIRLLLTQQLIEIVVIIMTIMIQIFY